MWETLPPSDSIRISDVILITLRIRRFKALCNLVPSKWNLFRTKHAMNQTFFPTILSNVILIAWVRVNPTTVLQNWKLLFVQLRFKKKTRSQTMTGTLLKSIFVVLIFIMYKRHILFNSWTCQHWRSWRTLLSCYLLWVNLTTDYLTGQPITF